MTPVKFKFLYPDGSPIAGEVFKVSLNKAAIHKDKDGMVYPDVIETITDAQGEATLSLFPANKPYYVSMVLGDDDDDDDCDGKCAKLRFRIAVPDSVTEVWADDLIVHDPIFSQAWDAEAIEAIMLAKAQAQAAASAAKASEIVAVDAASRAETAATTATDAADSSLANAIRAENARDASMAYASDAAASAQETDADRIATANSAAQALVSANAADSSAVHAKASEDAAKASEQASAGSQAAAAQSATNAAGSAANSATSATQAAASKDAAAASATAANASKDAAATSETKAKDWAEKSVDTPVEPGAYSAKHWAQKAAEAGGTMPAQIESVRKMAASKAMLGARQENYSSNSLIRWDLVEINGSTTIRGAQAFAFDEMNRHIYFTEGGAITRYPMDGTVQLSPLDTTGTGGTGLGHQGLAVERIKDTNEIKLWTTSNVVGRAAARFTYTPGVPITSDVVEEYELFPVGQFANNTSCTVTVSLCNRYVVAHGMIYGSSDASDTRVRVFLLQDLLDHGPGDCTNLVLHEWSTLGILTNSDNPLQGLACDGENVYLMAGGTGFTDLVKKRISVHTLQGELLSNDVNVTIGKDRSAMDGDGTRWEPEGLSLLTNGAGGVNLVVGILSGQPSQRRFRLYETGLRKPLSLEVLKLVGNTGNNFYGMNVRGWNANPEGLLASEPGSLVLGINGRAYVKRSGTTEAGWAELQTQAEVLAYLNSFGFANTGLLNSSPVLDEWRTTANFLIDSTSAAAAGLPITTIGYVIHHVAGSATNGHTQTATPLTSVATNKNKRWNRQMWAGVWTPWQEVAYTDSPILTGTPTCPTGVVGSTSLQIANMAALQNALTSVGWGAGNTSGAPIGAGVDLNTFTVPGSYGQNLTSNATLALNYPIARAGGLLVQRAANNMVNQTYTDYQNGSQWVRSMYQTTWSAWRAVASAGEPMLIGQYTMATLPSAAANAGRHIDVTDATGGPKTCRSNGTQWHILNTTTQVT